MNNTDYWNLFLIFDRIHPGNPRPQKRKTYFCILSFQYNSYNFVFLKENISINKIKNETKIKSN